MQPDLDRFTSRRSTVYGQRGVVATSQPLATEAGIRILRAGGNAFDAAVATALGGDVFALYRTADGDVGAMRACGGAPADATIENVRTALAETDDTSAYYPEDRGYAVDGAAEAEMPFYGPHAVTVPGTARGWEATIAELGRLSLADVLEPAIRYAIDGYPVSEVIASYWESASRGLPLRWGVAVGRPARDAPEARPVDAADSRGGCRHRLRGCDRGGDRRGGSVARRFLDH
jgi:gamma-glutamyltranspeptidase/glutathione hydrolase